MRPLITIALLSCLAGPSFAQDSAPIPARPDDLVWFSTAALPELQAAWALGSEGARAPYVLRARLAQGGRLAVHTHPDDRITTVLSGSVLVGFGSIFDETRLQTMPAGTVYLVPAHQTHYLWARDGDVEYQESGVGPTATDFGLR